MANYANFIVTFWDFISGVKREKGLSWLEKYDRIFLNRFHVSLWMTELHRDGVGGGREMFTVRWRSTGSTQLQLYWHLTPLLRIENFSFACQFYESWVKMCTRWQRKEMENFIIEFKWIFCQLLWMVRLCISNSSVFSFNLLRSPRRFNNSRKKTHKVMKWICFSPTDWTRLCTMQRWWMANANWGNSSQTGKRWSSKLRSLQFCNLFCMLSCHCFSAFVFNGDYFSIFSTFCSSLPFPRLFRLKFHTKTENMNYSFAEHSNILFRTNSPRVSVSLARSVPFDTHSKCEHLNAI